MSESLQKDTSDFLQLNQELRNKFQPEMPFFKPAEKFFLGKNISNDTSGISNSQYISFEVIVKRFLEVEFEDKEVQTTKHEPDSDSSLSSKDEQKICRSLQECLEIYDSDLGAVSLTDEEVILLVKNKHIPAYQIEKAVDDLERGVRIRRKILGNDGNFTRALTDLPYKNYDYAKVSKNIYVVYLYKILCHSYEVSHT